jgi:hypothetical protein
MMGLEGGTQGERNVMWWRKGGRFVLFSRN